MARIVARRPVDRPRRRRRARRAVPPGTDRDGRYRGERPPGGDDARTRRHGRPPRRHVRPPRVVRRRPVSLGALPRDTTRAGEVDGRPVRCARRGRRRHDGRRDGGRRRIRPRSTGDGRPRRLPNRSTGRPRPPYDAVRIRGVRGDRLRFLLFSPDRLRAAAADTPWTVAAVEYPSTADTGYYRAALRTA